MTDGTAQEAGLLLPQGSRLVHIRPDKTGTTSLQAALFGAREEMLAQGVRHVGRTRNPAAAVRAVTGQPAPTSTDTPPSMLFWHELLRDFRRAREPRVVVSSEFFAWAKPDVIERVVKDLDRDRLHIMVTLRPLGKILPSQWQQNVQAGTAVAYEDWLTRVFGERTVHANSSFWQLHRHDQLIERWAAAVGTDRVTAVVVDERDHGMLLRVVEGLLGLRSGTLVADRDLSNRSLTLEEVEAVRAFNASARDLGLPRAVHAKAMRFGSAMHMKQRVPGPDEPRIETPQWALDRAREVDLEMIPAIRASGVCVVGDLDSLGRPLEGRTTESAPPVLVPPEVAAQMAVGVLVASGLARSTSGDGGAAGSTWIEPIEVARVPTSQLVAVVARRYRARATRRLLRLVHRGNSAAHD